MHGILDSKGISVDRIFEDGAYTLKKNTVLLEDIFGSVFKCSEGFLIQLHHCSVAEAAWEPVTLARDEHRASPTCPRNLW